MQGLPKLGVGWDFSTTFILLPQNSPEPLSFYTFACNEAQQWPLVGGLSHLLLEQTELEQFASCTLAPHFLCLCPCWLCQPLIYILVLTCLLPQEQTGYLDLADSSGGEASYGFP